MPRGLGLFGKGGWQIRERRYRGRGLWGRKCKETRLPGDDGSQERLLALGQGWELTENQLPGRVEGKINGKQMLGDSWPLWWKWMATHLVGEHMPEWAGDRTGQHLPLELQLFATRRIWWLSETSISFTVFVHLCTLLCSSKLRESWCDLYRAYLLFFGHRVMLSIAQ